MLHAVKYFSLAGAVAAASGSAVFAGVEEPVELDALPKEVMEVATENLKGLKLAIDEPGPVDDDSFIDDNMVINTQELGEVEIISSNTETERDGSFVYEIQGIVTDGRKVEIDILPDGDVEEIEIEFKVEDVPGAVMKAIETKLPEFKPEFIEASHSPSMQVVGYEFVGMAGDAKMDIEVSADGRTITVADQ